jgi:hypothetical protein
VSLSSPSFDATCWTKFYIFAHHFFTEIDEDNLFGTSRRGEHINIPIITKFISKLPTSRLSKAPSSTLETSQSYIPASTSIAALLLETTSALHCGWHLWYLLYTMPSKIPFPSKFRWLVAKAGASLAGNGVLACRLRQALVSHGRLLNVVKP